MPLGNILYLAFVLGSFALFMGLLGWAQLVTKDVKQDRAITPAINPQAWSSSGLQTYQKAA